MRHRPPPARKRAPVAGSWCERQSRLATGRSPTCEGAGVSRFGRTAQLRGVAACQVRDELVSIAPVEFVALRNIVGADREPAGDRRMLRVEPFGDLVHELDETTFVLGKLLVDG